MFFCATLLVSLAIALVAAIIIDNVYHAIAERRWSPRLLAAAFGTVCVIGIAIVS